MASKREWQTILKEEKIRKISGKEKARSGEVREPEATRISGNTQFSSSRSSREDFATVLLKKQNLWRQTPKRSTLPDSQIPVEFWQVLEGKVENEMLFKNCAPSFWLDKGTSSE